MKVTVAPATGLPVRVAHADAQAAARSGVPTVAVALRGPSAVSARGLRGEVVERGSCAGSVTCATAAVAVKLPLVPFAAEARARSRRRPRRSSAVAWAEPSSKLAPAASEPRRRPPPGEPRLNVTVAPTTGLPPASSTRTASGCA